MKLKEFCVIEKDYFDANKLTLHNRHGGKSYYLTQNEKDFYIGGIKKIINKPKNNKLNGKIYLGRLSDLPRHKVKEAFLNSPHSKTSRIEQAGTIILNKNLLTELLGILERLEMDKYLYFTKKNENLSNFIINRMKSEYVISDFKPKYRHNDLLYKTSPLQNYGSMFRGFGWEYFELYELYLYRKNRIVEAIEFIEFYNKNPKASIIFDDEFLVETNKKDSVDLDESYLEVLDNMFESKDQANINLALEMLSNIDIEKYHLTIALFLNKHIEKFEWGSGLSLKKCKSFKSIEEYFKNKKIFYNKDWREFSLGLYNNAKTKEEIDLIKNFIIQNLNLYLKEKNKGELSIKDLSLNK